MGTIAGITTHGLQQTERKRNTSSTPTRECMFVATTSEDAVHPELDSSKVSLCVPDKEAGDSLNRRFGGREGGRLDVGQSRCVHGVVRDYARRNH